MSAVLSAKPYKSGISSVISGYLLAEMTHYLAVRCGSFRPRRCSPDGKETTDSIHESQAPAQPRAWEYKWVRCCDLRTPQGWPHGKDTCESAHKTQAPPASSKASARAG